MRKKILLMFFALALVNFLFPQKLKATTPSPTEDEIIRKLKQISNLKEKIATKVAELREKEKGALSGALQKIGKNTLEITGPQGNFSLSFSEDTLFYQLSKEGKKEISGQKLTSGQRISAFGYLNEDRSVFSAKYIFLEENPKIHFVGKIVNLDKENYTITLKEKNEEILVDVEKFTRTQNYDREKKTLAKSGFSKLKLGQIAHLVGSPNPKEEKRVTAERLTTFSFEN